MTGRLRPEEEIPGLGGATVGDFWAWAYSDILANTARGMFAEFLVGHALSVVDGVRPTGWEDFDLSYGEKKIEVKASAYVQNWYQKAPSVIRFDVGERGSWDANTNAWIAERRRSADCYVFCLYTERDRNVANVLHVNKWEFYALSTQRINAELGTQKSVGLKRLQDMTEPVNICQLKERIDLVLRED